MSPALDTTPDLFRAFADLTRLRLLNVLLEGEFCVYDLCDVLDLIQPTVSRHLAYLRRVGLVAVRQDSKWKYYSIIKKPEGLRRTLLSCMRTCLRETDDLAADVARLKKARGGTRCV
ncbi:MAG: metalloregulator ArsR/SmtB family transcription factor [Planctomycetes bacterium]|nr:metalloregulator ArsR/SmtB family transcription factor [Planctomycetota bacterium]